LQVILHDQLRSASDKNDDTITRNRIVTRRKHTAPAANCPMDFAAEIFGDRWAMLVLRDMLFRGKRHFKDMLASDEGIATNVLTTRLKRLEQAGLVTRSTDPANKRQVIYGLTPQGLDLAPVLIEIVLWSGRHDPCTGMPQSFRERAKTDRAGLIRDIQAGLFSPPCAAPVPPKKRR